MPWLHRCWRSRPALVSCLDFAEFMSAFLGWGGISDVAAIRLPYGVWLALKEAFKLPWLHVLIYPIVSCL